MKAGCPNLPRNRHPPPLPRPGKLFRKRNRKSGAKGKGLAGCRKGFREGAVAEIVPDSVKIGPRMERFRSI